MKLSVCSIHTQLDPYTFGHFIDILSQMFSFTSRVFVLFCMNCLGVTVINSYTELIYKLNLMEFY